MGEAERSRLGEICAYRGGKALPEELTAISLDVLPSEQLARAKEAERIEKVRRRRAGLPEEAPPPRKEEKPGAYGTFDASVSRLASRLALAVWNRIFGTSLGDVAAVMNHSRRNRSDDALSSRDGSDGRMKKKPSGAELSAYIGKATQAALGLSDPSRKVHARGVF